MNQVKISLVGAGSASFGAETIYDIASSEELKNSTVTLIDIDSEKLKVMHKVAEAFNKDFDAGLTIESFTNTKDGLKDSDFVIISVERERMKRWWLDYKVPFKYGIKQAMGECGGPGGLAHTLRQVPLIIDICRDVEDLCRDALVINYSNPESRVTYAMHRYTNLDAIGLCHGIYGRMNFISMILGREVEAFAAGINHFTWILKLWYKDTGKDAYPDFKEMLEAVVELKVRPEALSKLIESQRTAVVREPLSRELCLAFGYYPSPSDGHEAEFLPYGWSMIEHRERKEEWLQRYEKGLESITEKMRKIAKRELPARAYEPPEFRGRGIEIVKAMVTNKKYFEYAVNVANNTIVPNLPREMAVEVPAIVDSSGVHPVHVGCLPWGIGSLLYPQLMIQKLNVEAAYEGSYDKALEALLIDPVVDIRMDDTRRMLDELLEVHGLLLPQFRKPK